MVDVQSSLNLVPCNRGYDLYDLATRTPNFVENDPCSKKLTLMIYEEECPGFEDGVLKGPNFLFVDVPLEGYLRTDLGKKPIPGELLDSKESVQIPECEWNNNYLYPCDRHSFYIYNDTIIIDDAKGNTFDASIDVVPLYQYFASENTMAGNLSAGSLIDSKIFQWLPDEIFPNKLDNPRVKTWMYYHNLDSLKQQDPGILVLPIGALPNDLHLPLKFTITDRWFFATFPAEFTKVFRIASDHSDERFFFIIIILSLCVLIILDIINFISEIIKIKKYKTVRDRSDIFYFIEETKNPFSDIKAYFRRKSD